MWMEIVLMLLVSVAVSVKSSEVTVAASRGNMGIVYREQSKFTDALREYEEALRIEIVTLGKNHPEVATTRSNMGNAYVKQSKIADALREYEEVLPYLDRMLQTAMDFLLCIGDL